MNRLLGFSIFLLLIAVLSGGGVAVAQEGGSSWRVVSATPITLPEGSSLLNHIIPAPDGRHVAYYRPDAEENEPLCSMDVTTGEESCVLLPADFGPLAPTTSGYWSMHWSADSTRMAVVGAPLLQFRDNDLTVVDFQNGTASVLIDDAYEGDLLPDRMTPQTSIEIQPVWSPDGSRLVVEHSARGEDGGYAPATLSFVDPVTGEITDLSTLPGSDTVDVDAGSTIGLDWSPDGSTLAVSIAHRDRDPDYDGLWLVDAESGRWERLVTLDDGWDAFLEMNPGAEGEIRYFNALSWSPDGSRLLFWVQNPAYRGVAWPCWVDLDSGEVAPVPLPSHPNDHPDLRMIHAVQALWSSDGMILILAREFDSPEGETVTPLDPAVTEGNIISLRLFDPVTGESALLGHLPLIPTNYGVAAWGPDGDVLVNGYHLEMIAQDS